MVSAAFLAAIAQFTGFSLRDFLYPNATTPKASLASVISPTTLVPGLSLTESIAPTSPPGPQGTKIGSIQPATAYREHPDAIEIFEAIDSAPLFQRESVTSNYVGLKVMWRLRLLLISKTNNRDEVSLYLYHPDNKLRNVDCEASISEYPILKIMKDGDQLQACGTISNINYKLHIIHLSDITIVVE